jgi:hypothetical protein
MITLKISLMIGLPTFSVIQVVKYTSGDTSGYLNGYVSH